MAELRFEPAASVGPKVASELMEAGQSSVEEESEAVSGLAGKECHI